MLKNATQTRINVAQVHKFGGSSLASAARFSAVADIIQQQDPQHQLWVVVSAPGDTTDALLHIIACADDAACRDLGIRVTSLMPWFVDTPILDMGADKARRRRQRRLNVGCGAGRQNERGGQRHKSGGDQGHVSQAALMIPPACPSRWSEWPPDLQKSECAEPVPGDREAPPP